MKRLISFFAPLLIAANLMVGQPAQVAFLGPFQSTSNTAFDVAGDPDGRPGSWGLSKAVPVRLKITAPTGYRVRILHIAGDLVAWPKKGVLTGDRYAEVGWGLNTSLNDGSKYMSYPDDPKATAYDNCMVWIQDVIVATRGAVRATFDRRVSALLNSDGIMYSQAFVALNTSGLEIHLEPTVTVTYRFEKVAPAKKP